jgi:Yip1 domain
MDLMPRIIRIVVSPRDEWTRIAAERSHGALVHAFAWSLVPAAASFIMARRYELPLPQLAAAATYIATVAGIFILACAFWLLARLAAAAAAPRRCVQVAAYGATPLLVASSLLVSPVLMIACLAALLHVFYLYYLGVQQLLGVPGDEAAQFVAIALVIAIGASTLGGAGVGALGLL